MIVSRYIYSGHNLPETFDHNLNTGEKFKWEKLIKKEVKEGGGFSVVRGVSHILSCVFFLVFVFSILRN